MPTPTPRSQAARSTTGAAAPARRTGVLDQLRPTPRFAGLMGVFLVAAAAVGAREMTRMDYATETLGGEVGIGVVAVVFSLSLAVSSVAAGRYVDLHDPRSFLVGSLFASGAITGANAWFVARGPMPVSWLLVSTALEAATLGVAATALLKVQAAIVRPGARGSAETVNILRSGLGVAAGTMVAGIVANPGLVLTAAAVMSVAAGLAAAVVVRPMVMPLPTIHTAGRAELMDAVRSNPVLRRIVVTDLVLALVLPTQFIALVVADQDATEVTTVAFTASLLGLLLGRLTLVVSGFGQNPTRRVQTSFLGFTALAAIAVPALAGGWILEQPVLIAILLFVGGALMAFTQNLPIALLQQVVPEQVRGALSGTMNAARNLVIAATAAALAALTAIHNAAALAAAMTALLIVGFVAAGRFRGLSADDNTVSDPSNQPTPTDAGVGQDPFRRA